ncbi:MAG: hypothetical protein JXO22_00330, partial [Phycisphaerae bacterium]|nr:hypothetical protein [Phycisphaerae bacterium]
MPTAKCKINAGVCGFLTEVTATTEDGQNVSFDITSDCENVRQLSGHLSQIDAFAELGAGFDGEIFTIARESVKGCCSGCVV